MSIDCMVRHDDGRGRRSDSRPALFGGVLDALVLFAHCVGNHRLTRVSTPGPRVICPLDRIHWENRRRQWVGTDRCQAMVPLGTLPVGEGTITNCPMTCHNMT